MHLVSTISDFYSIFVKTYKVSYLDKQIFEKKKIITDFTSFC